MYPTVMGEALKMWSCHSVGGILWLAQTLKCAGSDGSILHTPFLSFSALLTAVLNWTTHNVDSHYLACIIRDTWHPGGLYRQYIIRYTWHTWG